MHLPGIGDGLLQTKDEHVGVLIRLAIPCHGQIKPASPNSPFSRE